MSVSSEDRPIIGYAGMTHLGLNSAVAAAERGFTTIGYDRDPALAARLQAGDPHVSEPQLRELMEKHLPSGRLRFTADLAVLAEAQVVTVSPDIPTDDLGQSNLDPLAHLIELVEPELPVETTLVILSQVPPGFTRMLKRLGNIKGGRPLYYQVETLVFGIAVQRALEPERYMVGCAEPEADLPVAYRAFLEGFGCPILKMRYESAELAKISINCCLVASVSVANTLAALCEKIGADWSEIAPSLKLDRRIGAYSYLAPGLGIAGGNLERDLATVIRLSDAHGTDAGVIRAFVANSKHRRDWVLRQLQERLLGRERGAVIGVLGLAYKQDTHSTKNSPSVALIESLKPWSVRAHDPVVKADPDWHPDLQQFFDPLEVAQGASALAIMTPWSIYKSINPEAIATRMRGRLVIDPFAVLNGKACSAAGLKYVTLGQPC